MSGATFPTVAESLGELCQQERFADVHFVVGATRHRVPAHRVILAARSQVFAAMLFGGMRESVETDDIVVSDVPSEAFSNVLWFMYTGQSRVHTDSVLATLYAAKKYAVQGLTHECVHFLHYNLSPENACQFLEQAILFDEKELAGRCRRHIEDSALIALHSESFLALPIELIIDVVQDSRLRIGEIDVLRACIRWADAELRRRELAVSGSGRRFVLDRVLPHVRFPLMSPNVVLSEVASYGIFSESELSGILSCLSGVTAPSQSLPFSLTTSPRRSEKMSLYVVGGSDGTVDLSNSERYDPVLNTWSRLANMNTVRSCPAAAVADNTLFAFGGDDSDGVQLSSLEWYDPHACSWYNAAPMTTPRSGHAAAVLDNTIYAVGGCDATGDLNAVERYDPRSDRWSPLPSMHSKRSGLAAASANGMLVAVGGYDGTHFLTSCERYDRTANRWYHIANMLHPRADLAAAAVGSSIYALGGFDGTNFLASVERYDIGSDRWLPVAPMRHKRRFLACAALDELLYAVGGHDGTACSATVERYDPRSDQWVAVAAMLCPRYTLAAAVL